MATSRRAANKPAEDTTDKPEAEKPTEVSKDSSTEAPAGKTAAAKPTEKSAKSDDRSYTDRAAVLADEVRAATEKIREQVEAVDAKVLKHQQECMPQPGEARVAGGVRRIPMASGDVARAVEGLMAAAVDLQRRAT